MSKQKIGVLGSGVVGQVLADGFLKHGHQVMRGSRDTGKLIAVRRTLRRRQSDAMGAGTRR